MAGTYSAVDLSRLAFPDAIQVPDFETIRAEILADMRGRDPVFNALVESDPFFKAAEVFAFREMLMRQQFNEGVRAISLALAVGSNLDHLAARFNVERLLLQAGDPDAIPPIPDVFEDDASLRRRTQLALEGFSTAGPVGSYVSHALNADAKVKDVAVTSPGPGQVLVTILSRDGNGTASPALQAAVLAALNDSQVRPLTDSVSVEAGGVVGYSINATLVTNEGPDANVVMAEAGAAIEEFVEASHRLGRNVTLSGIYAALHREGVQRVILAQPTAEIVTAHNEAPYCTGITLIYGGTGD